MKIFSKNILILCFCLFLSSCGGFTNPSDDCFLDWNMNCLDRQNQALRKSGYIYSYSGNKEEAKSIFDKCKKENPHNISAREQCLFKNGFKKS